MVLKVASGVTELSFTWTKQGHFKKLELLVLLCTRMLIVMVLVGDVVKAIPIAVEVLEPELEVDESSGVIVYAGSHMMVLKSVATRHHHLTFMLFLHL